MGCRSALSVWKDETGKPKFYGRFNQGVVTLNLVDIALSAEGDFEKFWKIFDERLDLCYRALMTGMNGEGNGIGCGTDPVAAWGAWRRLKKVRRSTGSYMAATPRSRLAMRDFAECTRYMTGKSHTDPSATPFALKVMEYMNKACERWKNETNIRIQHLRDTVREHDV